MASTAFIGPQTITYGLAALARLPSYGMSAVGLALTTRLFARAVKDSFNLLGWKIQDSSVVTWVGGKLPQAAQDVLGVNAKTTELSMKNATQVLKEYGELAIAASVCLVAGSVFSDLTARAFGDAHPIYNRVLDKVSPLTVKGDYRSPVVELARSVLNAVLSRTIGRTV